MILIKKGKLRNKVTRTAYDNFYKSAGWIIDGEPKKENKGSKVLDKGLAGIEDSQNFSGEDADDEESAWEEALSGESSSKPLSEMNKNELEEYAAELGVDVTGMTKISQMREAIKAVM